LQLKRVVASVGALVIAILAVTAGYARSPVAIAAGTSTEHDALQFQSMVGDHGAFVGTPGAVRGVPAAGLPWMIRSVQGDLDQDGELTIDVHGLVLADSASVPAGLRGTNPVPFFAAIVSCTTAVHGVTMTDNVATANFAATIPGGNAHIDQRLSLPHPCVAPVVMITPPGGGAWFAVTGT
jgi:hypothetical protein